MINSFPETCDFVEFIRFGVKSTFLIKHPSTQFQLERLILITKHSTYTAMLLLEVIIWYFDENSPFFVKSFTKVSLFSLLLQKHSSFLVHLGTIVCRN